MAPAAPGLESGLKLLEIIADSSGTGFNQLKNDLGLSPASLNRYLKTLIQLNFIEKNENKQYVIGRKMREISRNSKGLDIASTVAQPILENISATLGNTSVFIYFKSGKMICAAKFMVQEGLTMQDVGEERTDYILHPWGFLLLSTLEEKQRKILIDNANVYERFKSSIPDMESLNCLIREAKENDYSDDKGIVLDNIRRIAVPVYSDNSDNKLIGAIGIGFPGVTLDDNNKKNIVLVLKQKARSLNKIL